MELQILEVTKEEMELVLKYREEQEKERIRKANIQEGKDKMLDGYFQIIKNGGCVDVCAGKYVGAFGENIISVREFVNGIHLQV